MRVKRAAPLVAMSALTAAAFPAGADDPLDEKAPVLAAPADPAPVAAASLDRDDAPPPYSPPGAAAPIGTSERRVFPLLSVGTACAEAQDAQSCLFVVRAGVDLIGAELHLGALVGGAPHQPVGGLQIGGEWGTPYFKLTRRRDDASPHVLFMAVRNSIDFDLIGLGRRGFSNFVFSHRLGPNFAFGVTRRLRLFARLGVGFSLVSTTDSR